MANIISRPDWYITEREVTSEFAYRNRRKFLKQMGFAGGALATLSGGLSAAGKVRSLYPAKRAAAFNPGWPLTDETVATTYNNFYEFTTQKTMVHRLVDDFEISPWKVKVHGLCAKPTTFDFDDLCRKIGLEERVYRFRCVEAWAMTVPWTGFPMHKLLKLVEPKAEAKFVKFVTAMIPEQMPGIARQPRYPWPYTEGLTMAEAMHDLAFVATGIFGKPMPKQNGAPIRTVIPWKYGYKSIKSIVEIEFTKSQPETLWETLSPEEYPFESNVEPKVPHPRWSQATHRIVDTGERERTLLYNGYEKQVGHLYKK
ncbi:MAG: protein-methionine-sulfoxide reductase catalytic subunit MsrP [Verrucomicrobiales bacterium]|nr:protein-methionine-sulfoxide reductase catalytic subunit MsrP [Verrucomicrobiales bacterium]|tara:strand:+ start:116 stop:1054 length:939 start_codon:yes stop_codon:yes gene_type:complete